MKTQIEFYQEWGGEAREVFLGDMVDIRGPRGERRQMAVADYFARTTPTTQGIDYRGRTGNRVKGFRPVQKQIEGPLGTLPE